MYMYLRLMNELEELILKQPYKDGQKLPSIRTLSEQYGCSITLSKGQIPPKAKRHLF
ncbi:MAG: Bacterial regulatory protein gntR family [Clostridia bacterium]|nr:Bacterial regulatory protein gntR family [Clostridia bacterium]